MGVRECVRYIELRKNARVLYFKLLEYKTPKKPRDEDGEKIKYNMYAIPPVLTLFNKLEKEYGYDLDRIIPEIIEFIDNRFELKIINNEVICDSKKIRVIRNSIHYINKYRDRYSEKRNKYSGKNIKNKCLNCNKEFTKKVSQHKFCSEKCRSEYSVKQGTYCNPIRRQMLRRERFITTKMYAEKSRKKWTKLETSLLIKYYVMGLDYKDIGIKLKRTYYGCMTRFKRLKQKNYWYLKNKIEHYVEMLGDKAVRKSI